MGVHRLFGNNLSVVKDAVLTPSSVGASSSIFSTETTRSGSGTAFLAGNFTGLDDALFELRVAAGVGAGRITQSVFIGAGIGVLSGLSISGVSAQDFVVQLINLGIDTLNAEFDMGDILLKALASGEAGNGILVSVNLDELVFTETTFAVLKEISAGTSELKGPQWDWNTAVLNSSGEIPSDGMRLKFENDPQIYRNYKVRSGSDWVYYLSPGVVRSIPIGSKVYEVTGHRRATITDGVTTEQYPHVITLYDFAAQVRATSDLVEVVGVVVDDKTPGGMNCQDFVFVTDAYMHPIQMSGSKYVQRLDDIELQAATNIEVLEIECVGNAEMGYEAWSVDGSVTGSLPGVRTDESYIYGPVHFKIPSMLIDYQEPVGDMGLSVNYVSRDEGESEPPICLENRVLGVRAKTGSVTFTWTQDVTLEGCDCNSASLSGFVSAECLGLKDLGGEENLAGLDSEYKTRLVDLYGYIDTYTRENTYFYDESDRLGWKVVSIWDFCLYSSNDDCAAKENEYWCKQLVVTEYCETKREAEALALAAQTRTSVPAAPGHWYSYSVCDCCYANVVPIGYRSVIFANSTIYHVYDYVGGAEVDLKFMHASVLILLGTLAQVYKVAGALVIWDALLAEVKADLISLQGAATSDPGCDVRHLESYGKEFLERYQGLANLALIAADIVPGKSRSSSESAGCWSEKTDSYYWKASGSYLPAYNNAVYHSAKRNAEGEVYSTKEFALTIVCACSQHLKAGDQVTVSFDTQGTVVNTYQLGDKFLIPIIAAKDLELSGGVDGNDTHTWGVEGSVAGTLPDYLSVADTEAEYNQSGLRFLIERGGIPFELGDQWTFSVEGGKFWWRKDAGAWSAETDIGPQALSDGLSAVFVDGPAPSFVSGDTFKFKVLQPNSAEHIKCPTTERWSWVGSPVTLNIDCGGSVSVSEIFIADHNIPSSATVLVEGSQDGFLTTDWSTAMTWNDIVLSESLSAPAPVTHLRIVITGAGGCYAGWICAGLGLTTAVPPSLSMFRKYASITGGSLLAGGSIPMGVGWGGELRWENSISSSELLQLITLLDYLKENNNEPVVLLPHTLHEEEGRLCRVDSDSVEISDVLNYQPDVQSNRILSVTVPLEPVYL